MTDKVRLELDGPIATITNANVDKLNAFDDEMDARLWEILDELKRRPGLRVVIWRAEGKSWSLRALIHSIAASYIPTLMREASASRKCQHVMASPRVKTWMPLSVRRPRQ